jgi:hypothetical protein
MCVLTIKKDVKLNPIQAKACNFVLDNHKNYIWMKSKKYTPVLPPNRMHLITSMAVEKCCTLKQGDCKNTFCQGFLPDNKITKLLSLPSKIQIPRKINIGYSSIPFMAYAIAHGIGIPKSVLFSPNLASARVRLTPAFLQVKWSTLQTPLYQQHPCHSHWSLC